MKFVGILNWKGTEICQYLDFEDLVDILEELETPVVKNNGWLEVPVQANVTFYAIDDFDEQEFECGLYCDGDDYEFGNILGFLKERIL